MSAKIYELDEFARTEIVVSSEPVDGLKGYYRWKITGRTLAKVNAEVRKLTTQLGKDHVSFSASHRVTDIGDVFYGWVRRIGYTSGADK